MIQAAHRLLAAYPHESISSSTQAIIQQSLRIDPNNFAASLPLELRHLRQIESILKIGEGNVENNYVIMATNYIIANHARVNSLIALDRTASYAAISGDLSEIQNNLLSLPSVDKQSLMVLKLYAAIHSYSDDINKKLFEETCIRSGSKLRLSIR
nr:hypothetical protein [Sphingomonas melonis]